MSLPRKLVRMVALAFRPMRTLGRPLGPSSLKSRIGAHELKNVNTPARQTAFTLSLTSIGLPPNTVELFYHITGPIKRKFRLLGRRTRRAVSKQFDQFLQVVPVDLARIRPVCVCHIGGHAHYLSHHTPGTHHARGAEG